MWQDRIVQTVLIEKLLFWLFVLFFIRCMQCNTKSKPSALSPQSSAHGKAERLSLPCPQGNRIWLRVANNSCSEFEEPSRSVIEDQRMGPKVPRQHKDLWRVPRLMWGLRGSWLRSFSRKQLGNARTGHGTCSKGRKTFSYRRFTWQCKAHFSSVQSHTLTTQPMFKGEISTVLTKSVYIALVWITLTVWFLLLFSVLFYFALIVYSWFTMMC